MNVLGIDYGRRKLGLALAKNGFSEPFLVLQLPKKVDDHFSYFVQKIGEICLQGKIEKIIVGFSRSNPDFENEVKNFADLVKKETQLDVELVEESMTTKEAQDILIKAGYNRKKRKEKEDAVVAALLLEDYITSTRQHTNTTAL